MAHLASKQADGATPGARHRLHARYAHHELPLRGIDGRCQPTAGYATDLATRLRDGLRLAASYVMDAERVDSHLRQRQSLARLVDLRVAAGPYRAPHGCAGRHLRVRVRAAEGDVFPAHGPGFFGPDAGGQA